ncbi:MAG TPA: hypothetical protein VHE08_07665 [Solirubrobacterales bacterium]|nr:hypothetical protein [Solirubrobacterales bacterium]
MALSDEQNAMLRLLASGEQGYGDIAALVGLSEEEVRAKVVGALAQLQAEGKPAPDIPPPLPGGAKPAAEATAPEPEAPQPAPAAKEEPPAEPVIAEPTAPGRSAAPKPAAAAPPAPSGGRTLTLPSGRGAWLLGGGILAAIVVIVVVVILASGGGGGSSTTPTAGGSTAAAEGNAESGSGGKEATQAELTAVDGSEAAGLATFGRVKNKLALQIEATGLEPTTEGTDAYTIWLAQSPRKMLPLASTAVKGGGKGANQIAAEFEVPVEVLAYLAKGTFDQIAITRTRTGPLEAALKVATKRKTTPAYTGEAVLRGPITGPIVGLAQREEERGE